MTVLRNDLKNKFKTEKNIYNTVYVLDIIFANNSCDPKTEEKTCLRFFFKIYVIFMVTAAEDAEIYLQYSMYNILQKGKTTLYLQYPNTNMNNIIIMPSDIAIRLMKTIATLLIIIM